jgi:hypothetical protein
MEENLKDLLMSQALLVVDKGELKTLFSYLKKVKPKSMEEFAKAALVPMEEMKRRIWIQAGSIKGLYLKDIEKFIKEISKSPTAKKILNDIENKMSRFSELYAKNKYLSSTGSGKEIRL